MSVFHFVALSLDIFSLPKLMKHVCAEAEQNVFAFSHLFRVCLCSFSSPPKPHESREFICSFMGSWRHQDSSPSLSKTQWVVYQRAMKWSEACFVCKAVNNCFPLVLWTEIVSVAFTAEGCNLRISGSIHISEVRQTVMARLPPGGFLMTSLTTSCIFFVFCLVSVPVKKIEPCLLKQLRKAEKKHILKDVADWKTSSPASGRIKHFVAVKVKKKH